MPTDAVRLGANYWRLARQKDGTPLYKQEPLAFFAPSLAWNEPTEAQFPPDARQPYTVSDVSDGQGQAWAPFSGPNTRYDRVGDGVNEGVDCSLTPFGPIVLSGLPVELPLAWAGTRAANFTSWLWPVNGKVYFPYGQTLNSFDGTSVAQVGTLVTEMDTGGNSDLLRFQGSQTGDYWYLFSYNKAPQYSADSGVTWNALTTTSVGTVRAGVVLDGEVVCAVVSPRSGHASMVESFDDGGSAPTAYGVIDPIGNPNVDISKLVALKNRVLVLKSGEGIFALTANRRTLEQQIAPELLGVPIEGGAACVWRDIYWCPTDRGLYAITPDLRCRPVGPDLREARSTAATAQGYEPSSGVIFGVAGDAYNLYALRFNPVTGVRWLLKANVTLDGNGGVARIVWHDFLKLPAVTHGSLQAVTLGAVSYALTTRKNGAGVAVLAAVRLPQNGADPRNDSGYRYTAAGTFYPSRLHARFPALVKTFFGVTPLCAALQTAVDGITPTVAQAVRTRVKLDTTSLATAAPWGYAEGALQQTGTGARDPLQLQGRGLDVAVRLTSSDPTTSPQLQAVTAEFEVEPAPLWRHTMTLDVSEGGVTDAGDTGGGDPMTPAAALAALRALAASGAQTLVDPWGNAYTVTVPPTGIAPRAGGPREESSSHELPLLVDVIAVEQAALAGGTYGGLALFGTYGNLLAKGWTYGQLATV